MKLRPQSSIASRIRTARIERGFSQQRLGADVGVSAQQIFKYENAKSGITAPRLAAVAQALNRPLTFFYDEAELPGEGPLDGSSWGRLHLLHAYEKLDKTNRGLLISIANSLVEATGSSVTA